MQQLCRCSLAAAAAAVRFPFRRLYYYHHSVCRPTVPSSSVFYLPLLLLVQLDQGWFPTIKNYPNEKTTAFQWEL